MLHHQKTLSGELNSQRESRHFGLYIYSLLCWVLDEKTHITFMSALIIKLLQAIPQMLLSICWLQTYFGHIGEIFDYCQLKSVVWTDATVEGGYQHLAYQKHTCIS